MKNQHYTQAQLHTTYFICATPRCGSSLLAEALKNTGIAGRPEEYFWRGDEVAWKERWGVSTNADFLSAAIRQGTTRNGVFGAKVMWGYFDDFINELRHMLSDSEMTAPVLLSAIFPNLHYIWITRHDKVRQAVSHWKAIQTGVWALYMDGPAATIEGEPVFDFEAIDFLVQEIIAHESAWGEYFAVCGVKPYTVIYEELETAYEETALQILQYMHIPYPQRLVFSERRLRRQTDALSEKWLKQYYHSKRA